MTTVEADESILLPLLLKLLIVAAFVTKVLFAVVPIVMALLLLFRWMSPLSRRVAIELLLLLLLLS